MKYSDPFKILQPNERWAPTQSQMDAFQNAYEKLLPPLGYKIRIEYQAKDKNIREYDPDFFVKTQPNTFFILETKGREDLDDLLKIKRLVTWGTDINKVQADYTYTPFY